LITTIDKTCISIGDGDNSRTKKNYSMAWMPIGPNLAKNKTPYASPAYTSADRQ